MSAPVVLYYYLSWHQIYLQENEAQSFLTKIGLRNYVEELVVKNKVFIVPHMRCGQFYILYFYILI
jgi:hypothetical protein